jgi:L-serine dehydratase
MFDYCKIADLVRQAEEKRCAISAFVLADQAEAMETSPEKLYETMRSHLLVMQQSARAGSRKDIKSASGLTGGDGFRMTSYAASALSGPFCAKAVARAIAVAECNAAMGKIVAAPTAGSCGILPAAILTMMEERGAREKDAVMALFTAGAFGLVIAREVGVAGAEGGCQAECGTAAALAAAALVELAHGTPDMSAQACAIALKNQLGLVCDPVAGLVEVPCVKRNAGGVMCAITAADMALAGIKSVIPPDEVISAMRAVGDSMPESLRETAKGGLAATPTGIALRERIFGG